LQYPDEIERWFQAMLDWRVKPNQNTHVVMMRGSRWETVLHHNRVLEERQWLSCISLSVFIDSCGYNDQFQTARAFWERARTEYRPLMTTNVYTSMIEACGRCGELGFGRAVLAQFEEAAPFLEQTEADAEKLYQTFQTQIVAREPSLAQQQQPLPSRDEGESAAEARALEQTDALLAALLPPLEALALAHEAANHANANANANEQETEVVAISEVTKPSET
jgi:hypothetical protein